MGITTAADALATLARESPPVRRVVDGTDDYPKALMERIGLVEAINTKSWWVSKKMIQRLAFAAALVGNPDLLCPNGSSMGFDPAATQAMRDFIRKENGA